MHNSSEHSKPKESEVDTTLPSLKSFAQAIAIVALLYAAMFKLLNEISNWLCPGYAEERRDILNRATSKDYLIRQLNSRQCYLLCMNENSILYNLAEIENEDLILFNEGELIVDQLLVAGNGRNRFLSCRFANGELELSSAKNIEPSDGIRRISSKLLLKNIDLLDSSILTDAQLDLLRHGGVI